jgi:integrase
MDIIDQLQGTSVFDSILLGPGPGPFAMPDEWARWNAAHPPAPVKPPAPITSVAPVPLMPATKIIPSINALLEEWQIAVKRKGRALDTLSVYRSFSRFFSAAFPVWPTSAEILDWLDTRGAPDSKTWENNWKRCNAYFKWVKRVYKLPNPMDDLDKNKVRQIEPRSFSRDEAAAFDSVAETDLERSIVAVYMGMALRKTEGIRLQPEDIYPDRLFVHGKARDEYLPLTDMLRAELTPGVPFSLGRHGIGDLVNDMFRRAGIQKGKKERLGPHVFRHTFATLMVEAGGDPYAADKLSRHEKKDMQSLYQHHYTPGVLRDMLDKFGPLTYVRSNTDATSSGTDSDHSIRESERLNHAFWPRASRCTETLVFSNASSHAISSRIYAASSL